MRRLQPVFLSALVVLAATIMPAPALAETFLDLYGGYVFLLHSDTTINGPGSSVSGRSDYKDSFVVGGRAGYYFDVAPNLSLGLALDVSYFKAEVDAFDGAESDVVPISLLFMMRYPLDVRPEFPHGRFQPHFGFGPSVVYSRSKVNGSDDSSFDPGVDVRLGLTWMLTRTIGLFGEYRFSYVKAKYEFSGQDVDQQFIGNHVTVGATLRF